MSYYKIKPKKPYKTQTEKFKSAMNKKIRSLKKLQNDLSKLDVHYLTNHPSKMNRKTYLKKRSGLNKKFLALTKRKK